MKETIKILMIQLDLTWEDPNKNLQRFSEEIKNTREPIDLIILPEMFTTGFSMNAASLAEETHGRAVTWMKETAREFNSAITGSLIIKENGKFFNRLFFVYPNGDFETYDKRHTFTLANEDKTYTAGTEKLIVEYEGWRICPLICYDLRFPVWARNTENYDVLIYVANWPETRIHAWDILLQSRAIENMSYCLGVNRTGNDGNAYKYNGHTAAYDCLGESLFENNKEKEFTKIVTLEKSHLTDTRDKLKFLQDRDSFSLD